MARLTDEQIAELDPEVLRKAMRAFDEMGWGQGQELCKDGSVCAVGAVQVGLGLVPVLEDRVPPVLTPIDYPPFPKTPDEYYDGFALVHPLRNADLRVKQDEWVYGARRTLLDINYSGYVDLLDDVVADRKLVSYQDEDNTDYFVTIVDFNDSIPQSEGRQRVEAIFAEAIARIEAAKSAVNNKENASV